MEANNLGNLIDEVIDDGPITFRREDDTTEPTYSPDTRTRWDPRVVIEKLNQAAKTSEGLKKFRFRKTDTWGFKNAIIKRQRECLDEELKGLLQQGTPPSLENFFDVEDRADLLYKMEAQLILDNAPWKQKIKCLCDAAWRHLKKYFVQYPQLKDQHSTSLPPHVE